VVEVEVGRRRDVDDGLIASGDYGSAMTDQTMPPPASTPTEGDASWWKKKRGPLATWAWIGIGAVVVLIGIGAAGGGDDSGDATGDAPSSAGEAVTTLAQQCTAPIATGVTEAVELDQVVAVAFEEGEFGWNYLVAGDVDGERAIWVTDVVDGDVVGMWSSMNDAAEQQAAFPQGSPGTDTVADLPEFELISTCPLP
jgi:hypothetical protein